jgi:diguanylate cyclase (GGDEF)-like protein
LIKILNLLKNRSHLFWVLTGLLGVLAVGLADYLTGTELAFSLFYLVPIMLVAWFSGGKAGLAFSLVSAVAWFTADTLSGQTYSRPIIPFWNAGIRLSFFLVVTLLLTALKHLENERGLARLDELTGAANRRHFFEVAQAELDRSRRYKNPFSIAYIDLDDFKVVNDRWGHRVGDELLCALVKQLRRHLRKTDFLARLGGDEFIILFPETDQPAARTTVAKLQKVLLDEMQAHQWPVTFSIGILTCRDSSLTPDDLINQADALMYSVKKSGKDDLAFSTLAG